MRTHIILFSLAAAFFFFAALCSTLTFSSAKIQLDEAPSAITLRTNTADGFSAVFSDITSEHSAE